MAATACSGAGTDSTVVEGTNRGAYSVFISHAGPQKPNVAGPLRRLLQRHVSRPFLDRDDLEPGCLAACKMEQSCRKADVVVFIMTEDFFRTPYTLKELQWALEARTQHKCICSCHIPCSRLRPHIITVLWPRDKLKCIEVANLRDAAKPGRLLTLLNELHNDLDVYRVSDKKTQGAVMQSCKNLKHLASLTMMHAEADGIYSLSWDDDQIVANIAVEVKRLVDLSLPLEQLFGRADLEQAACSFLLGNALNHVLPPHFDVGSERSQGKMLCLHGMGGVGKTALAWHVHQKAKEYGFETIFVELGIKDDISAKRSQLIKALGGSGNQQTELTDLLSRERTSMQPLFLTLDNVFDRKEAHTLLGANDLNKPIAEMSIHMRVLITTRQKNMFTELDFRLPIHKLDELQIDCLADPDGINMLCRLAFQSEFKGDLPHGFPRKLLEKAAHMCQGLPLSLKLLSGYLQQKSRQNPTPIEEIWKDEISSVELRLTEIGDEFAILGWSYETLTEDLKRMFLDVALVMHGEEACLVEYLWTAQLLLDKNSDMSDASVRRLTARKACKMLLHLQDVFLVQVDKLRGIIVHDRLVEMARAREDTPKGWALATIANPDDLESHKGPDPTRIVIDGSLINPKDLHTKFPNVQYIHYKAFQSRPQCSVLAFKQLLYLRVESASLSKCDELLMMCVTQVKSRLGVLRLLSAGVVSLPSSLGNLGSCLEQVQLTDCLLLQYLPETFSSLSSLQHLGLAGCSGLISLPHTLGELRSLRHLDLAFCSGLTGLPHTFGELSRLQHLDLAFCSGLTGLPGSFGSLSSLKHLDLEGCNGLTRLPDSFGNLSCLQKLDLTTCSALAGLPDSFGNLGSLQLLGFRGCSALNGLPYTFGNLSSLQHLDLNCCSGITDLPSTFGCLSSLQHLKLKDCCGLTGISDSFGSLSSLQHLDMEGCSEFTDLLDSFGGLSCLDYLDLRGCKKLILFPGNLGQIELLATSKQALKILW